MNIRWLCGEWTYRKVFNNDLAIMNPNNQNNFVRVFF